MLLARPCRQFLKKKKSEAFGVFPFINVGVGQCVGVILIIMLAACKYVTSKGERNCGCSARKAECSVWFQFCGCLRWKANSCNYFAGAFRVNPCY